MLLNGCAADADQCSDASLAHALGEKHADPQASLVRYFLLGSPCSTRACDDSLFMCASWQQLEQAKMGLEYGAHAAAFVFRHCTYAGAVTPRRP